MLTCHGVCTYTLAHQKAEADSANQKGKAEDLGQTSMIYREKHMRRNVASKNTVVRYMIGPEREDDDDFWDPFGKDDPEQGLQETRRSLPELSPSNGFSFLPFGGVDVTLVPRSEPRNGNTASRERRGEETVEVAI